MKRCVIVLLVWCSSAFSYAADTNADDRIDRLIRQLKDADFDVRIEAAHELGKLGSKAKGAVPALIEALKNKNSRYTVRRAITEAFVGIGPDAEAAIPALLELLKDDKDPDYG